MEKITQQFRKKFSFKACRNLFFNLKRNLQNQGACVSYKYCLVIWPRVAGHIIQPNVSFCLSLLPSLCDRNSDELRISSLPLGLAYLSFSGFLIHFQCISRAITTINEAPTTTLLKRWGHFHLFSSDTFVKLSLFFLMKEKITNAHVKNLCWWEVPEGVCEIELLWERSFFYFLSRTSFSLPMAGPWGRPLQGPRAKRLITTVSPPPLSLSHSIKAFPLLFSGDVLDFFRRLLRIILILCMPKQRFSTQCNHTGGFCPAQMIVSNLLTSNARHCVFAHTQTTHSVLWADHQTYRSTWAKWNLKIQQ